MVQVISLSFLLALSSCASTPVVPLLQNRTLELSREKPEAYYQYEVCVKKFLFCTKKEMQKDTYDLNDKEIRSKLVDTGFRLRVME